MGWEIVRGHPSFRRAAQRGQGDRSLIEISLFGLLVGTLGSALSGVLMTVGLTATTYVAMTIVSALRAASAPRGSADRAARALGIATTLVALALALTGLRVGSVGSGGELVPSLALAITAAAALGSSAACGLLASARGVAALGAGRRRRLDVLEAAQRERARRLRADDARRLGGRDLADEVAEADAALARLEAALDELDAAREALDEKLRSIGNDAAGPIGVALRHARDEVGSRIDLGERVLVAAQIAAFRLACNEPLRLLARRRPQDAIRYLERLDAAVDAPAAAVLMRLDPAAAELGAFLVELDAARRALDVLAAKRPRAIEPGSDEDPWALAEKDLTALQLAFTTLLERVEVVRVRHAARAKIAEVAIAAEAVAQSARGRREGQIELEALAAEVTRAEAAAVMATPLESDARALTTALARSASALAESDSASLDELLKALRSIA